MPRGWRWLLVFTALVAGASLALAPFLFNEADEATDKAEAAAAKARQNAKDNAQLICSLGRLLSSSPIARRPDENDDEFRKRVFLLRDFARDLRMIEECDPERPTRIHVVPEDRPVFERERGGDSSSGQQPGGLAGPPDDGGPPHIPPVQTPPPGSSAQPSESGLIEALMDDACAVLGIDCPLP